MLIVLDTNVLVSAMLKRNSKPSLIMNAILEGKIQLAIDERIFTEYTDVLHRPKLGTPFIDGVQLKDARLGRFFS